MKATALYEGSAPYFNNREEVKETKFNTGGTHKEMLGKPKPWTSSGLWFFSICH
jgi:hypothetical protein